jgi:hypothetical protein
MKFVCHIKRQINVCTIKKKIKKLPDELWLKVFSSRQTHCVILSEKLDEYQLMCCGPTFCLVNECYGAWGGGVGANAHKVKAAGHLEHTGKVKTPEALVHKVKAAAPLEHKVKTPEALVHKVKAAAPLEHKVKIPEALVHKVKTPEALVHKVKAAAPLERKVKTPEAYKHKVKAAVPLEHKVKTPEAL